MAVQDGGSDAQSQAAPDVSPQTSSRPAGFLSRLPRLVPPRLALPSLVDVGRGLAELILPSVAHDSREATAAAGLSPDAWGRVQFLEDPVCDGCGAGFEFDGGDFASDRCAACLSEPYAFQRARAACVYDEASRGLILKFKHGDQQQFAGLFARWISRSASELITQADAVAPVPLHPMRLLSRRFNQAAEIARPLARRPSSTICLTP